MKISNGRNGIGVLTCHGNLNAASMVRLKNSLSRLMNQNQKRFVLDLGRARRADFSGLGILIERLQKIRALRGDIRIVRVRPAVSRAFNQIGLNRMVALFGSTSEAIRSYQLT